MRNATGPGGVRLTGGIGCVAIQFPEDVGRGAVEHVLDIGGIGGRAAVGEQGHISPRQRGVGRRWQLRMLGRRSRPGIASIGAGIGIKSPNQRTGISGVLIETVDVRQGIRSIPRGGIGGGDGVIIVAGSLVATGIDHAGATGGIMAELRIISIWIICSAVVVVMSKPSMVP